MLGGGGAIIKEGPTLNNTYIIPIYPLYNTSKGTRMEPSPDLTLHSWKPTSNPKKGPTKTTVLLKGV